MYAAYFGLKENPFKLTPEPRYLFLSEPHRDVSFTWYTALRKEKGFVLISGGIGTGKTTICRTLLNLLDSHPSVETALIFNTAISDLELLEAIVKEFGIEIPRETGTKKAYVDALNDFLLKNFAAGKNAVLLIDEAQNLSHSVLEQIRMLSNLETEKEKLLQIILIGQPELKTMLTLPALQQLNDRITVRYDLIPLSADEVIAYIEHRLRVAGGPGKIKFTKGAYRAVYDFSEGVPRRINALCDRAFLIAYAKNISKIDRWVIRHAARDIGSEYFQKTIGSRRKSWLHLNT